MTVVIGLKHEGEVWIAADSRVTDDDGTKFDLDVGIDSKLFKLNHCVIGFAGDLTAKSMMESYLGSHRSKKNAVITDRNSVMKFFLDFRSFLKTTVGMEESEIAKIDVSWLVATKERLFVCDGDNAILEFSSFCTIGTGAYSARAVLEYTELYNPELSPQEKLTRAHKVAVKHNATCGGTQEVYRMADILKSTRKA